MTDAIWAVALLGFAAGAMNALAGGGPIIVVAALAALGIPANIASLTSTVALLPGQVTTGWSGRHTLVALGEGTRRVTVAVALAGGAAGAVLLLFISAELFQDLLPGLIAFATLLYAWNSRAKPPEATSANGEARPSRIAACLAPLAVYGGFYGGGNSFMVLALLARLRVPPRAAAHAKNLLVLLINAAATCVFLIAGEVRADIAIPLGTGALAGSLAGVRLIDRIDAARLRILVIALGLGLAAWLALRG